VEGDNHAEAAASGGGLATRWVELVFALLIAFAGGVVMYDSARIGAQWASDGPQAGFFPWFTGLALALSGGWVAAKTLWRWRASAGDVFVSWARLRPVLAMLLPTIAYVALMRLIGLYVASAIFIFSFMLWQGRYRILPGLVVALAVPTVVFLLFELWFLIPLPKGPIERMFGF
jgi:putative tricarboxylic transport membrane protein